jgi:2'-5' RNA ligase
MAKRRLGVALLVPAPVDAEIDGLRRAAGDGALGRIPAHITLVPPVNVREERMDDALARLRTAAAEAKPFEITLGPPASFLPDSPTLYLAVSGPGLDDLHALRDRVFADPLARPLTWPFVPHVTLADEMAPARIDAALSALADYEAHVRFERLHLLQEGAGRMWTPIADAPFRAPAVIGRGGLPLEITVSETPAPHWFVVTARRQGEVVGRAEGWTRDDHAHLVDITVALEHQGQGIGSHLLAACMSLAAERGCTELTAGARLKPFRRAL